MSIMNAVKALGPVGLRIVQIVKAKSPTILVVSGIVSGITAGVVAVKRTPLCANVKAKFDEDVEKANACLEAKKVETENGEIAYTDAVFCKDLRVIYAQKYFGYLKIYAPSFILGAASVGMILWSHGIMMKRNAALTATVATISKAFKEYRKNVRDEFGEEVDHRMRHGLVCEKTKGKETDPETGKEKTVTKEKLVKKSGHSNHSDYARCFDVGARGWTKDAAVNRAYLMGAQSWANQRLRMRGFLFLNEIYNFFDIDETLAGSEMGWIYTKNDDDNQYGDNFVDFGFDKDPHFMSGEERSVWLDFNVDDKPIRDRIRWAIK